MALITLAEHVDVFCTEMNRLNNYINSYGEIKPSSIIKSWHELNNMQWASILYIARELDQGGALRVPNFVSADIDTLLKHLRENYIYCDNVLYPTVAETRNLPHDITHLARDVTVKSRVFRTMMNLREAHCHILGVKLPNSDASVGMLDATPYEVLFNE